MREANIARFQISLVERDSAGAFLVWLMGFGLKAESDIVQVLFFKSRSSEAIFTHRSGKVTINTDVLDGVQDVVSRKLAGLAQGYIATLDI